MDKLKRAQRLKYKSFQKECENLEAVMGEVPLDLEKVQIQFHLLNEVAGKMDKADQDVLTKAESVDMDEDEQFLLIEDANKHRKEMLEINSRAQRLLQQDQSYGQQQNQGARGNSTRKLPKLELPKFDGDVREWLPWWSQFQEIDQDPTIPDSDKFQYLIQSTKEGSDARELVMSFPVSAQNYKLAVAQLEKMYGKEKMLIKVYVRDLLKLVIDNAQNKSAGLQNLYFRLSAKIKALATLGVTTEKCASVIYPLVESCLPEEVLRAWQRSPICQSATEGEDELVKLIEFLEKEVGAENNIKLACTGLKDEKPKAEKKKGYKEDKTPATAASLVSSEVDFKKCIFCEKGNHQSDVCSKALNMPFAEKQKIIKEKQACFKCLRRGHIKQRCKSFVVCVVCQGKHASVMCPTKACNQKEEPKKESRKEEEKDSVEVTLDCSNLINSPEVLLQTIQVKVQGKRGVVVARAMFDSASQRSYVTKDIAKRVGLEEIGEEEVIHGLFGGVTTQPELHKIYKMFITDLEGKNPVEVDASDKTKITGKIRKTPKGPWMKFLKENGIWINDIGEGSSEVGVLLGSDMCAQLITGKRLKTGTGPVAVHTTLGWTLIGKVQNIPKLSSSTASMIYDLHVSTEELGKLWELDVIGITEPTTRKAKEELEADAMRHFMETVKIKEDGRYEVKLPWIEDHPTLPSNKGIAEKRLRGCTASLKKKGAINDYSSLFKLWEEMGIVEEVPENELDKVAHYLPHHAVMKPTSATTPIRPVFDASCKEEGRASLNDCLATGPNLIEIIPAVITRFRTNAVGVTADIAKAFQQISVAPEDRDYLRFLWWKDMNCTQLKEYRHCRVVFGVNASPFLLGAVLKHILERSPQETEDTAMLLLKSLYVDNVGSALASMEKAEQFERESHQLLLPHKMELRTWEFGPGDEDKDVPLLGLIWNMKEDVFKLDMHQASKRLDTLVTKRKMLALAHTIYDPIGFTAPLTLLPKLLLQRCCKLKLGWDEEIGGGGSKEKKCLGDSIQLESIRKEFTDWRQSLMKAGEIKVPRQIASGQASMREAQLHVFGDASKDAYAACVFLRVKYMDKVTVQLVQAKSRVSPQKNITIPRSELLAGTIGARLGKTVQDILGVEDIKTIYWTDSTTVLQWIREPGSLGVFVRRRVEEILKLSSPSQWRHIRGTLNPADLPSRGCSVDQLIASKWWEGPDWLKLDEEEWPVSDAQPDMEVVKTEFMKKVTTAACVSTEEAEQWAKLSAIPDYDDVLKEVAREKGLDETQLGHAELTRQAEDCLIKLIQQRSFDGVKDEKLKKLPVYVDKAGIIRVKTRLLNGNFAEDFMTPAVLPTECSIVSVLIMSEHITHSHTGVQTLLGILRERFWILKGRKTVRSALLKCEECRRYSAKKVDAETPALPKERVQAETPFQYTGIDLAGPLHLSDGTKAWIVLFTCSVYRAIHLELVPSLCVGSFKDALRRFVARRGRPDMIWTDNGTNFTGCNNAFKRLNWKKIEKYGQFRRITWRHIPPTAPWWGGWWERMVGLVKGTLRRVLGKTTLNYQELETVLCDAEATINMRPITYVSDDVDDLIPLSPHMFMTARKSNQIPEADLVDGSGLQKRYKYMQMLREHLRSRFRKEYLGQLRLETPKKTTKLLRLGERVLVGQDGVKRLDWPLGRIIGLTPGRDGVVRVVKVEIGDSIIERPIQRIYPLEADQVPEVVESSSQVPATVPETANEQRDGIQNDKFDTKIVCTKFGRKVKLPIRFTHVTID